MEIRNVQIPTSETTFELLIYIYNLQLSPDLGCCVFLEEIDNSILMRLKFSKLWISFYLNTTLCYLT
jgi:hypothetical protein